MNRLKSMLGRRGHAALITIVATAAAAALAIPAFAVSNTGLFELDGNAVTSHLGTTAPDDWDRVCHDITNDGTVFNANGTGTDSAGHNVGTLCPANGTAGTTTNGADALEWTHPASQNEVNFSGGGSKDPNDISSWAYTQGTGGNPGKDILTDGFAAKYHEASTGTAGNCPTLSGSGTCKVLFFGMDRFDNSGDAQNGFWFFQNKITLGTNSVPSGTGFVGVHKTGDVLVTTDFSIGGTTSTIDVYAWDPTCTKATGTTAGTCGDANLRVLFASTSAKCSISSPSTPACGIVNQTDGTTGPTTSPWPFLDKAGNTSYAQGEFFEGGLNISDLSGLNADECFASTMAESRSSTSTTATLKVFILGGFGACGSKTVTTPSQSGAAQIPTAASTGGSVLSETDSAAITVTGTSNFGGTVQFSLCFNPTTNCASGGTAIGSPVAVNGTNGSATVGSPTAYVTSVGTYCWRADYSGDSAVGVPGSSDPGSGSSSTSECFSVTPVTPTLTTAAGPNVLLGNPVTDTATLSGTANEPASPVINTTGSHGPSASGTITFTLFGPNDCTTVAAGTGTNPQTVNITGDGTTAPVSFTPSAVGTYHWVASYSGDLPNTKATDHNLDCSDTTHEDVTVSQIPTTVLTAPSSTSTTFGSTVTDNATITATIGGGPNVTGTLTFFICTPSQVTANGGTCSTGGTQVGSPVALSPVTGANPPSSTASSNGVTANITGTWCFRGVYTPDTQAYTGNSDATADECFLVTDTTSANSNQNWLPNDTASVSSTSGAPLNGKLTIQLYVGSTTCAVGGTAVSGQSYSTNANGTSSTATVTSTNSTFTVSASTSTSWLVTFTSTDPNVSGSSHCESSSLTISN